MPSLRDKKLIRFTLFQIFLIMVVIVAHLTGFGLLSAIVIIVMTATLLPVEKINNMVLLFLIIYFGSLLGIITTGLFVAFWK